MNSLLNIVITPDVIMYSILSLLFLVIFYALWKLNQDNKSPISIIDLVAIDGKLNERKFSRFGAWIVSTWGFIYLIVNDKLSEWYFVGYMAAWVANALIGKATKDPNNEETPIRK
jgi:hypothetical protein